MASNRAPTASQTIVIDEPALRQGFTVVPNFLFGLKGLSHGARLTYVLLLKYAWQEDHCFPGIERLAEQLEVERKSVIRYTQELMQGRLISIERRGQGKTNVYHLNRWTSPAETPHPLPTQVPQSRSPMHGTSGSPLKGTPKSPTDRTQIVLSGQEPSRIKPSVNAVSLNGGKEAGRIQYLVDEILKVCGDACSTSFYRQVASRVDDSLIFVWLSEIRHDSSIANRGAVFTSKLKAWRKEHAAPH